MMTTDDIPEPAPLLIDEGDPPQPDAAARPPKPPTMGGVDPSGTQQRLGYIEPKVVETTLLVQPSDELLKALSSQRDDLIKRVGDVEALIGFVVSGDELSVRVAKIELFLGVR
jgi:hypothetical protein